MIADLHALLGEAGYQVISAENADSKLFIIDKLEDAYFLHVHGTFAVNDVYLLLAKLK